MKWLARQQLRFRAAAALLQDANRFAHRPVEYCGVTFRNPLGAAAGLDHDARLTGSFAALGFGFAETGTVNSLEKAHAISARLAGWRRRQCNTGVPMRVGINFGNLRPALDCTTARECAALAQALAPAADYLVLNLSRPRSPGRCQRPDQKGLKLLLDSVRVQLVAAAGRSGRPVPLLVKVAVTPGDDIAIPAAAIYAIDCHYDGIVAAFEGWPAVEKAARRMAFMHDVLSGFPVIAVGSIQNAADAGCYLDAGAVLVEMHRALLKGGTSILPALAARAREQDTRSVS